MSERLRGPCRPLLLLVLASCTKTAPTPEPSEAPQVSLEDVHRTTLGEHVELLETRLFRASGSAGRLFVLYADPNQVEPALVLNPEKRPLAELEPNALLVMNAGYFTPEWKATGLLLSKGQALSPLVKGGGSAGSGVLWLEQGKIELLRREEAGAKKLQGAQLALQSGPRIIEPDGSPGIRSDDGARANRSVIGRDGRGYLALVVCYADQAVGTGPTLFELQRILGPDGLGEVDKALALSVALNLDGGPSTGLQLRNPDHPVALPEANPVLSALVLRIKE